jgi:hypothetical protein
VDCRQVRCTYEDARQVCKEHNKGSLCLSVLLHSRWCLILQFPSSHGKAGVPFPPERKRKIASNN